MANITGTTRGGTPYEPTFVTELNAANCIGCGRCYKVCGQGVFALVERADLGLEDDDYEDEGAMVMSLADDGNCIGCKACGRVCPKGCHEFISPAA